MTAPDTPQPTAAAPQPVTLVMAVSPSGAIVWLYKGEGPFTRKDMPTGFEVPASEARRLGVEPGQCRKVNLTLAKEPHPSMEKMLGHLRASLDEKGKAQFDEAMDRAKQTSEQLAEDAKVDPDSLREPMTI